MKNCQLFFLVKSLSKTEKQFLSRKNNGRKNHKRFAYRQLIETLQDLDSYDEEMVIADLKRKLKTDDIQYSYLKNYTYHFILKSLRQLHDGKSIDFQLSSMILDIRLLQRKGLYDQCTKRLRQAKKLSIKYEKHHSTLELLDIEMLLLLGRRTKTLTDHVEKVQQQINETLSNIRNEARYKELLYRIFTWYRTKSKIRDEEGENEYQALVDDQYLSDVRLATTFQSKISFFFSHALINHILRQKLNQANQYYYKVVEVWKRYPHMKDDNYKLYKIHLSNYLNSCHMIGKYEGFLDTIRQIERIPCDSFDERAEEFQNVAYLKLLYYLNKLEYESLSDFAPEIEKGLEIYSAKVNKARLIAFQLNLAIFYFFSNQYEKADQWIRKIFVYEYSDVREDIQVFARVLHLVVNYELNNRLLLDSLHRSASRKLRNTLKLTQFESLVLKLITELQKKAVRDHKEVFDKFFKKFEDLENQGYDQKIVGLSEVMVWVRAKRSNEAYLEVLRKDAASMKSST